MHRTTLILQLVVFHDPSASTPLQVTALANRLKGICLTNGLKTFSLHSGLHNEDL